MSEKYTGYTADRLLNDDYFVWSELFPTEESRRFWENLIATDARMAKEIRNARLVLGSMTTRGTDPPELPGTEQRELWGRIDRANKRHVRRKISFISAVGSVAAAVMFFAFYLFRDVEQLPAAVDYRALIASARQIGGDSDDVRLVLSDNRKYHLGEKESEIEYGKGEIRINSVKIVSEDETAPEPVYNTLIVPAGRRSVLTLSDGTKMWVKSESRVVYPMRFDGTKREIFVEGEVYLDVFRNEHTPFIVRTGESYIRVLGTQFNVLSLPGQSVLEVVLVSGQVEVTNSANHSAILVPDELYKYDESTGESSVSSVDIADYVAWKDGYFPFKSQTMDVVLAKIGRYYGIKVDWTRNVSSLVCSGKLDLGDDPAQVFSLLKKAAPIAVQEINGEYLVRVEQ